MAEASRLQPTRRAAFVFAGGFVLAALPALAVGGPRAAAPWLVFCALFAVACAVDAWRCPGAHRLGLEVTVPHRLGIGAAGALELSARLRPGSRAVATADVGSRLERPAPVDATFEDDLAHVEVPLVPRRRGITSIEAVWLRYTGPWGLVRRTVTRRLDAEVEILPDLGFVHSEALRLFGFRDARVGTKIERYTGDGSEFDSLRDFVTGDDPRSIDWKASARHTKLVAREMRAERNHQVVLALDTGRLMAEPVDGAPLVDHAIHAGLPLARVSLRHGDRVGLFSFAEKPGVYGAARGGAGAFPALLHLSSRLRYSKEETNFTLGLTNLSLRLRRRSLVIVLTDFVDTVTAELMVENLLRLARRHLVLFVAFRDPALAAETARVPVRLVDIERAGVAETLLLERRVVLERLRRAGLPVIEGAPREVGAGLVNRYLGIKRREMI